MHVEMENIIKKLERYIEDDSEMLVIEPLSPEKVAVI